MKVSKVFGFCFLVICALAPLSAQDAGAQAQAGTPSGPMANSDLYFVQVPIEKIWQHPKGYIVEYRKTALANRRVYIPTDWFDRALNPSEPLKAEVMLMDAGKAKPRMILYYKDGKFDHVRLYVRRERSHGTWGNMKPYAEYDKLFDGVEELKLDIK
jgi:hypothetical protein